MKEQIKNFFYFHDRCLGGENKKLCIPTIMGVSDFHKKS